MNRSFLLGIDVGTQSTRVALIDPSGKVHALHASPNRLVTPRQGWGEEDPEEWWDGVVAGIRSVLAQAGASGGEVLGIGCDAQMHATVPIGATGELLSRAVQLWCDKRGASLVEDFLANPSSARAARIAGSPPVAAWIGFKILWLQRNQPEVYRKTWKFLSGAGFINYRLTGEAAMDWSEASGSFLLDSQTLRWSEELAACLGIDLDKLPRVAASSEVIGQVSAAAARLTGLQAGTPVVAGAGDMLCMLVASGLAEPGYALDITGTASDMVVYVPAPVTDPPLMNLHHALPGWTPFGIAEAGGGSLKWLKDEFCQAEVQQARAEGRDVYAVLNEKAARVEPGCEGLLYLPYLMGERVLGSPYSRGVFFGLTPRSDVGALVRSVMEGVTFELRRTLELVEAAGNPVSAVYTAGGGARSRLWSQIKADIYHKPVITLAESEGGILGSAILAGAGVGVYPDVPNGVRACVRVEEKLQPDPTNYARYDALYTLFKDLHDQLQPAFGKLSKIASS
jgi:xylulokinase